MALRDQKDNRPTVDQRRVVGLNQLPAEVRVVQEEKPGEDESRIMTGREAWEHAVSIELDLILIAKDAKPPVYRLCDYGKFKYAEEKHAKELARSNREHQRTVKEVWLNQNIGPADYDRNMKRIRDWLPEHDVRIGVNMRGHRGRANRMALPRGMAIEDAPRWNEFILNRALRDLGNSVRADRISAGLGSISTMVRLT